MENFLIQPPYIKNDPNNRLTISANSITFTGVTRNENGMYFGRYLGRNKFANSFTDSYEGKITAASANGAITYMATYYDRWGDISGSVDHVDVLLGKDASGYYVILTEFVSSVPYQFGAYYHAVNTQLYFSFEFNKTVGTYGTVYLRTYTDAAKTVLVNTQTIALHKNHNLSWFYPINTFDDNTTPALSGVVGNYNIGVSRSRRFFLQEL